MATLKDPVTADDHIQGDESANATLVEYGDYECPYCGLFHHVRKRLQTHFGKQLRFVFRNFPLSEVHPHAELAAVTAEFAADHKHFWEMHDLIYENQQSLSNSFLLGLAETLGLSMSELEKAIENETYVSKIRKDFMSGVKSGVNGTPTLFINGQRYNGPFEFRDLVAAIDSVLVG